MLLANISIGTAGSTSWERCALGLPSLITISADNQRMNASILEKSKAIAIWENANDLSTELFKMVDSQSYRYEMHKASQDICDGLGCPRIVKELINYAIN